MNIRMRSADLPGGNDNAMVGGLSPTLAEHSESLSRALKVHFARKGVEPHEIDDLIQEVFLRILKRGDSNQLASRFVGVSESCYRLSRRRD
jgi:DNA-directed RNA polymerase specialized sigma24 family protein